MDAYDFLSAKIVLLNALTAMLEPTTAINGTDELEKVPFMPLRARRNVRAWCAPLVHTGTPFPVFVLG